VTALVDQPIKALPDEVNQSDGGKGDGVPQRSR
jgi:hypothetical protein